MWSLIARGRSFPKRIGRWARLALCLLAVLFCFYPNPSALFTTIGRTFALPVDAVAASGLADALPDDPKLVEAAILRDYVPYAYDWDVYGIPWYFPTVSEVLRDARGDCQSRAVLIASVLSAKGLPYEIRMSPVHVWIDYSDKSENSLESDTAAFARSSGKGFSLSLPEDADWGSYLRITIESLWDPMPWWRKTILGLAILLLAAANPLLDLFLRSRRSSKRLQVSSC